MFEYFSYLNNSILLNDKVTKSKSLDKEIKERYIIF